MKVRELKNFFELQADEAAAGSLLVGISHWVKAVLEKDGYSTSNPKDVQSLRKLEELKLVELREKSGVHTATLTSSGRELYQDFYGHGYYL
jgi:hypothetical protein